MSILLALDSLGGFAVPAGRITVDGADLVVAAGREWDSDAAGRRVTA